MLHGRSRVLRPLVGWRRAVAAAAPSRATFLLHLEPEAASVSARIFAHWTHIRPRAFIARTRRGPSTAPCPCRGPTNPFQQHSRRAWSALRPPFNYPCPGCRSASPYTHQARPGRRLRAEYIFQGSYQILGLPRLAFSRLWSPLRGSLH